VEINNNPRRMQSKPSSLREAVTLLSGTTSHLINYIYTCMPPLLFALTQPANTYRTCSSSSHGTQWRSHLQSRTRWRSHLSWTGTACGIPSL
jgi:hypothetical protein